MSLESLFSLPPENLSNFKQFYGFGTGGNCYIRVNERLKQIFKSYKLDKQNINSVKHILRDTCIVAFDHPNIPKVHSLYFAEEKEKAVLSASYQYIQAAENNGNVHSLLESKAIYNIFKTIQYIHQNGIHHCDLDIANILFLDNGDIAIIDFDRYNQGEIRHADEIFVNSILMEYSDEFALLIFSIIYSGKLSCSEDLRNEIHDFVNAIDKLFDKSYQSTQFDDIDLTNVKNETDMNEIKKISKLIQSKIKYDGPENIVIRILENYVDAFINSFEKFEKDQKIIFEYNKKCMNMHFISESLKKNVMLSKFIDYAFKQSKNGDPDAIAFLGEVFLTGVESNLTKSAKIHYICDHTRIKQRIETAYLLFIKAMRNGSDFARDRISAGFQIMKSLLSLDSPTNEQKILLAQMCEAFGSHIYNFWGENSQFKDYFFEFDDISKYNKNDLEKMLENADPELIYNLEFKQLCTIKAKEIYEENNFDFLLFMMKIKTLLLIDPTNSQIVQEFNNYKEEKIYYEDFDFEMSFYYWYYIPDKYEQFEECINEQMLLLKRVPEPNQLMNFPVILQADVFEHLLADYFQLI